VLGLAFGWQAIKVIAKIRQAHNLSRLDMVYRFLMF
jgi:hypothetical protein